MTGGQKLFTGRHECHPVTMLKNTLFGACLEQHI